MGTTSLIVELLIIGFQVLALLAVFSWSRSHGFPFSDEELKNWFAHWTPLLKDWMPLLTIGMLGAAYALGIAVDRFYGCLGSTVLAVWRRLSRQFPRRKPHSARNARDIGDQVIQLVVRRPDLLAHTEGLSRHIRLLRATFYNGLIGLLLVLQFLPVRFILLPFLFLLVFLVAWRYSERERYEASKKACQYGLQDKAPPSK
jgi:hypothetical protein